MLTVSRNSYLLDSLKLCIAGKYEVSDSDLMSLSDTIVKHSFERPAAKGFLVQLIYLMDKYGFNLPCSFLFLKESWMIEFRPMDFTSILNTLIQEKVVTLKRVTASVFMSSGFAKSHNEDLGKDLFTVVYATKQFRNFLDEARKYLVYNPFVKTEENVKRNPDDYVTVYESFGYSQMGKKYWDFLNRLKRELRANFSYTLRLESFSEDFVLKEDYINIIIYTEDGLVSSIKDEDLTRNFKKFVVKSDYLREIIVTKDSNNSVFISFTIDKKAGSGDLFDIASSTLLALQQTFYPDFD